MKPRTLEVGALARVEGEGGLKIRFRDGRVRDVELRIYEPPRFFEAFLRGRSYAEAPDITARICGICPVAYQMSSCQAMEDALGMTVVGGLRDLRRLLYCGEWIESHALHVFLLHAPDFLGYPDAMRMAKDHPDLVRTGLRLKKAGNAILERLGGRAIHPVNVRVGGFYRVPSRSDLEPLRAEIEWGREAAREMAERLGRLSFPELDRDYEFVALRHSEEYAVLGGRIVSNRGLDADVHDFDEHFVEEQVPHSNALHAVVKGRGAYLCGPLARFNLNFDRLSAVARDAAQAAGLRVPCRNPFRSLLVRLVEIVEAFELAGRILDAYTPPADPFAEARPRPSTGYGCTEAPRGMLFHRYRLDADGIIEDARIVPPTSQNQKSIEEDLFVMGPQLLERGRAEARHLAEHAIRNHDPCISCATHFLDLTIEEE